jgi:autotransporter-associated beta strand protein
LFAIVGLAIAAGAVAAQTSNWLGTTPDWNTASNWAPSGVPDGPTAAPVFGPSGSSTSVNVRIGVQVQSLGFSDTRNYTVTSTVAPALSGVTAIAVGGTGTATINLVNTATGSLLMPGTGTLSLSDTSTSSASSLVIGPNTVIGATGGGGAIAVSGTQTVTISGSFATAPNAVTGGITKTGLGKLILKGDGTNLSGGLTLGGGTVQLDYTISGNTKIGSGGVTSTGGVLSLVGNTSFPITQTIAGASTFSQSQTDIVATSAGGGSLTLAFGTIGRGSGGTFDISTGSGNPTFTVTTTTGATNGLLGTGTAFATLGGGSNWASVSGGTITAATYGTDTYASGVNTDVVSAQPPAGFTTNSLRFNVGSPTITLTGSNTLQSGGILQTSAATGGTIAGGSLTVPGAGELVVLPYGSGALTINSDLTAAAGLTKSGAQLLNLGGNNTGLTGPININRGSLTITNPASVNSASQINFNDSRGSLAQNFAVDLGNSATGTISAPIRLSAIPGAGNFGTFISTGSSSYSHVTLGGVISSAAGSTTPVYFSDLNNTNEIDFTNANTFTGTVFIGPGVFGITSDANFGNPANVLTIEIGSTVSGGLLFLNSGITVSRPVTLTNVARLISNGTDVNTIAGHITGTGGIVKDGTGTLILNNSNGFSGTVTVNAGTLSLGTSGTLQGVSGSLNNVTVASGATFSPATATSNAFNVVTLNGGTFRVPGGSGQTYTVNQFVLNSPGVSVDFSAAGADTLKVGSLNINANTTWLGAVNGTAIPGAAALSPTKITVAPGVTFTNGLGLTFQGSSSVFQILGGGTLYQNSLANPGTSVTATLQVLNGRYRVTDVSSAGGVGNLGTGNFTLDGGTFAYGGASDGTSKEINLTSNNGTIEVESAAARLQTNGSINGPGGLTKAGAGTLALANLNNSFSSLNVAAGSVEVPTDGVLGSGPVTVGPLGTLFYSATSTTTRNFNLNSGALGVSAGQTLTLNGGSIGGGFVVGPGTLALTGGSTLGGTTTASSLSITVTGPATFLRVTNGAAVNVAGGLPSPIAFSLFTNEGSGSLTVGAVNAINVSDFQTYGTLTINPAAVTENFSQTTLMTNVGTSQLNFNGGSRTFVGTPATAVFGPGSPHVGQPTFVAGVDLNGKNAVVAGGLFVNNGYVEDTTNGGTGTATIVADFGSLVKGAGFFQNTVQTINGGKFQSGNSPGSTSFGRFVLGPGGVSSYVFAIDDATGAAGPIPDAAGHVSGWGLVKAIAHGTGGATTPGDFTWTATAVDRLLVSLQTLVNPTTVGIDVPGMMDHFDPNDTYVWPAITWTGSYAGPANDATLNASTTFDTSRFANPVSGRFGWALDTGGHTLSLTYTPTAVPEPGTFALLAAASVAWVVRRRR